MHLSPMHLRILRYLEARVLGATDDEIVLDLGIPANSMRPRRHELVLAGKVKASENQRLSFAGHEATVWVACDEEPVAAVRSRSKRIAEAAEPLILKAQELVERYPNSKDWTMCGFPISLGALRALVKAASHDA